MSDLKPTEQVVVSSVCLQEGIVPLDGSNKDISRALNPVNDDDRRKMKRRFRKLWRKAVRIKLDELDKSGRPQRVKDGVKVTYGLGKGAPSKSVKRNRKSLVMEMMKEKAQPIIDAISKSLRKDAKD